jgi:hypothetical protein
LATDLGVAIFPVKYCLHVIFATSTVICACTVEFPTNATNRAIAIRHECIPHSPSQFRQNQSRQYLMACSGWKYRRKAAVCLLRLGLQMALIQVNAASG